MMVRPRLFSNSEEDIQKFEDKVMEYIEKCETLDEPVTISGLCVHMKIGRTTLWRYSEREGYKDIMDFFKERVMMCLENETLKGKYNSTMAIFSLKNNFGWTDKVQTVNENTNVNKNIDCSSLTDEQIDRILNSEE